MENEKLESLDPELEAELKVMMAKGLTISAIKRLREATGCGLADAKTWVDRTLVKDKRRPADKPCPYCGKPLRTDLARQCFECGADWHDAGNVIRRSN